MSAVVGEIEPGSFRAGVLNLPYRDVPVNPLMRMHNEYQVWTELHETRQVVTGISDASEERQQQTFILY